MSSARLASEIVFVIGGVWVAQILQYPPSFLPGNFGQVFVGIGCNQLRPFCYESGVEFYGVGLGIGIPNNENRWFGQYLGGLDSGFRWGTTQHTDSQEADIRRRQG